MPADVTPTQVIEEAQIVYDDAARRLSDSERELHERGYHAYSAALANMRNKYERAMLELVEEVGE